MRRKTRGPGCPAGPTTLSCGGFQDSPGNAMRHSDDQTQMRYRTPRRTFTVIFVVALLAGAAAGCGKSGPTRYRVSGSVTFKGKPVPVGSIQFTPDASKGNTGPSAFAGIKNGKYDSAADGLGTVGGPQIASVEAFDGQNIDPNVLPNGKALVKGFRKSYDLPKRADATLDIELSTP
jgi:hypothetical protein